MCILFHLSTGHHSTEYTGRAVSKQSLSAPSSGHRQDGVAGRARHHQPLPATSSGHHPEEDAGRASTINRIQL